MKNFIIIALLLCVALLAFNFSGCVTVNFNPFAVAGAGARQKYEIDAKDFSKIDVKSLCDINYHVADNYSVTLEIQPNLRQYYTVEAKNGVLYADTKKNISFGSLETPILTVYAPSLKGLNLEGMGTFTGYGKIVSDSFDMKTDGMVTAELELETGDIKVNAEGAGDITLSGTADTAKIKMDGMGTLDAMSLKTRTSDVKFNGTGNVRVNCEETLVIDAEGLGTVEYKGSPSVSLNKDGLIKIKQVN